MLKELVEETPKNRNHFPAALDWSCGRMSHFADQKAWELFLFTREVDSRSKLKTH